MESKQQRKCPVCDWVIDGKGIEVQVAGKAVVVCCDDCAAKARKPPGAKSAPKPRR